MTYPVHRTLLLLLLGMLAVQSSAAPEFSRRKHSLGTLKSPWQAEVVYEFRNTGEKAIVIQSVTSNCGCTVAEYPQKPIKPGRKGKIRVQFNGQYVGPGFFHRTITVATSDWQTPVVRLYLEGTILKD